MRAIEITTSGGPEVLAACERPVPTPGAGEVLIRVIAAAVNRPDIQQRKGLYPPPPGVTDIPGLDVSGVVCGLGPDSRGLRIGDSVCALVAGGGYAEYCVAPAGQCMPLPPGFSYAEAAALPEAFMTAWVNVLELGGLAAGERLLVHGGTSGVGMAAIQLAVHLRQATVLATAGTEEKREVCREIGATAAIDYRDRDWATAVRHIVPDGVDVILDSQAGDYVPRETALLREGGRLVMIGLHRGKTATLDLRDVVYRRLHITGSTLRRRSVEFKTDIAGKLVLAVWPLLAQRTIRPRLHTVLPLEQVSDAHAILDENRQIGKVVLAITPDAGTNP